MTLIEMKTELEDAATERVKEIGKIFEDYLYQRDSKLEISFYHSEYFVEIHQAMQGDKEELIWSIDAVIDIEERLSKGEVIFESSIHNS